MAISRLSRPLRRPSAPVEPVAQAPAAPSVQDAGADLITPDEAAALLKVGRKVLERWRGAGGGPAYLRFNAKTIRYRQRDVQAFIDGSVRTNTAG